GKFQPPASVTDAERAVLVDQIAALPAELRSVVSTLDDTQLDTPYREGGWTVRQVVHHVPDSHVNAYTRFKLALTEDVPTIKTYEEAQWAELPEARSAPIGVSLALLEALHQRWVLLLRVLAPAQFARSFRHPELGVMTLDQQIALYAWHGRHHLAHITSLRTRMGW
ncbi:MAG TPA: putative metal-dependent hydrolase, partial [Gemmataceae bacterium]|nr:putative metal-dependent hydrolase [Gemmataceae bacterium]